MATQPGKSPFPGKGATPERIGSAALAVLPLLGVAFFASVAAEVSTGWVKVVLFVSGLLVSSFAYDSLKTILLRKERVARKLFWHLLPLAISVAVYLGLVALLAWIGRGWQVLGEYPALILLIITILFMYIATRLFLQAVHYAVVGK